MTNVLITNSFTISAAYTGNGFDFSGFQIQLIQGFTPLTYATVGNTTTLYWAGGALQSSSSVNGPFTPVTVGGVPVTSPYVVPAQPANSALFFIAPASTTTDSGAPGLPVN